MTLVSVVRPKPTLLVLSLLAVTFAGCISTVDDATGNLDDPLADAPAVLKCFPVVDQGDPLPDGFDSPFIGIDPATILDLSNPAPRCNQDMTPDEGRHGNEVTIAVNPTNPKNIVGGAKDYYLPDAGECVWDGVYVTHDGGLTYEDRSFDGSPWRARQGEADTFHPTYASQFWCTTDPVAYFDVNGNLYYLLMAYQADPVTGSDACQAECEPPEEACDAFILTPCPHGAMNDWAFNRAVQIIAISDDGGDTFHTFTPVLEGTFPVNFHDKGWLAASSDGTIHVMWLAFYLPGNQYCRSTDGGQTYLCTDVTATQFVDAGQGSFLEVGTGGQVYAIWHRDGIMLKKSDDYGATWGEATKILDTNPQSMPGLSPRDRRGGFPMIATDRNPDSPNADAVYAVWNDKCQDATWADEDACAATGPNSIYFAASTDEGSTWTEPIRINDDRDENGTLATDNWQIFPAVSVSPGGVIDVSWMDTRGTRTLTTDDGTPYKAMDQYYTYSLDGGKTWAENVRVRDVEDGGWDPALSFHQNGMVFIGDYNDIDSSWGAAHPVWPDTRYGIADVFTAIIERPLFAEGWDADAQAEQQAKLVSDGMVDEGHPYLG